MARKITVWLPDEDEWLVAALDIVRAELKEEGWEMSRNDLIRKILNEKLTTIKDRKSLSPPANSMDKERGLMADRSHRKFDREEE